MNIAFLQWHNHKQNIPIKMHLIYFVFLTDLVDIPIIIELERKGLMIAAGDACIEDAVLC